MDKVYQVFISSTFTDLKDERQQVSNTLAKAGYIAAGMELFPAADQQQLEYIKRIIDRSDYYVVVLGGRYGSLADDTASYTEKEFEYARSKGIPILAFLHKNPRALAVEKTDEDPAKAALLEQFRKTLANGRMVDFWSDANDLCMKVVIAVANAVNLTPRVGWVRGDQAIDPKVLQELERLRIENTELQERMSKTRFDDDLVFDPNLLGPDDVISMKVKQGNDAPQTFQIKIGDVFVNAYDPILAGSTEEEMRQYLGRAITAAARAYKNAFHQIETRDAVQLRNQFLALGLIETVSKQTPSGATNLAWSITPKGKKFAALRNALRKNRTRP